MLRAEAPLQFHAASNCGDLRCSPAKRMDQHSCSVLVHGRMSATSRVCKKELFFRKGQAPVEDKLP